MSTPRESTQLNLFNKVPMSDKIGYGNQSSDQSLKRYQKPEDCRHKKPCPTYQAHWRRNHYQANKNDLLHRLLNLFYSVKSRCRNKSRKDWRWYGGKGIKNLLTFSDLCYLWFRDRAWNLKKPTIDRIESTGNYFVSNCRFIEHSENLKESWKDKTERLKSHGGWYNPQKKRGENTSHA